MRSFSISFVFVQIEALQLGIMLIYKAKILPIPRCSMACHRVHLFRVVFVPWKLKVPLKFFRTKRIVYNSIRKQSFPKRLLSVPQDSVLFTISNPIQRSNPTQPNGSNFSFPENEPRLQYDKMFTSGTGPSSARDVRIWLLLYASYRFQAIHKWPLHRSKVRLIVYWCVQEKLKQTTFQFQLIVIGEIVFSWGRTANKLLQHFLLRTITIL